MDTLVSSYPSDLMKSTVVDESLSSTQLQFCSRENQLATRRMGFLLLPGLVLLCNWQESD